jgi:ElaB/YqjD/DUF883 family membrane-anchored ribosome-binding protein
MFSAQANASALVASKSSCERVQQGRNGGNSLWASAGRDGAREACVAVKLKEIPEVFMNAGTQMKENLTDIAEKARDLSAKVRERLDETYNDLGRTVRRAKEVAEDRIDDVRSTVRNRPLTSVASVAVGGFAIGLLVGWLLGRRDRV